MAPRISLEGKDAAAPTAVVPQGINPIHCLDIPVEPLPVLAGGEKFHTSLFMK